MLVVGGGRVGAYLAKVLRDGGVEHVVLKMSNRSAGARARSRRIFSVLNFAIGWGARDRHARGRHVRDHLRRPPDDP